MSGHQDSAPADDVCRVDGEVLETMWGAVKHGEGGSAPHVTQVDDIRRSTWRLAEEFVEAVHHRMPIKTAALLDDADLPALCIALAALIDPQQTRQQQLAWADTPLIPRGGCGRPNYWASWKRHQYHGQQCAECHQGYKQERRVA